MNVALVYDRVNKFGGAERVLQALHQIWPNAPLYTSVYHSQGAPWAQGWDVRPSNLQRLPFTRTRHEYLAPLMPRVFESLELSNFDVIISITSAEAKGVITSSSQLHLSYILSPTRYLWSHAHEYAGTGLTKAIRLPLLSSLRRWDYLAAQRPDKIISISRNVSARIRKYYRRDPEDIIYPPVNYQFFSDYEPDTKFPFQSSPYYLLVSRLVPYKKVDLAISAFTNLPDKNLVIVGTGSQARHLKNIAPSNVIFMGAQPDDHLKNLYQHAKALIFPQEEDFGITSLEAQSAGIPVLGLNRGGSAETVIHEKTGILFDNQSDSAIIQGVELLESLNWSKSHIRQHARQFRLSRFKTKFKKVIEELWHNQK